MDSDSEEQSEQPRVAPVKPKQSLPRQEWSDVDEPQESILETSNLMPKKRNMSMEEYMHELVGKQFYDFVQTLAMEN